MKKTKDIGLYYVLVGLEAIEDRYLDRYEKHSDVDHNIQSIAICKELGIHLMGMFIIDLGFRAKDFRALYQWIAAYQVRNVALSIFTPELGTPTYEQYRDRIITDNPSHFDYLHLVAKPDHMRVGSFYFHYYILLIRLFLKAKREGVYDFIDYGDYIRSFVGNILRRKRRNDDA